MELIKKSSHLFKKNNKLLSIVNAQFGTYLFRESDINSRTGAIENSQEVWPFGIQRKSIVQNNSINYTLQNGDPFCM